MARYIITVCLAALLILLSIAGLIACAFGVLDDVDHVVLLQTLCYFGLIVPLYFLSRVDGTQQSQSIDRPGTWP